MPKQHTIHTAAESIAAWAYSDSHVEVDKAKLRQALMDDQAAPGGRVPNEEECEQIICGNDDGEVPPEFGNYFPATMALLETYW